MIALLVDQNFNEHIVDGLIRKTPTLDIVHVRDIGLAAASDSDILERAATQDRVLLTHDRKTIPSFAYTRIASKLPMPGVFLVGSEMPIGRAIDELLIAIHCLSAEECNKIVKYFPM